MAYSDNIAKDAAENQFFVKLRPRRYVKNTEWVLDAGSVYKIDFPYGNVYSLLSYHNALASDVFTEGTSSSLSAGQFYHDRVAKILYMRKADSTAPVSVGALTDYFVVTFEVYLSTQDVLWYRTPTDSSTEVVEWVGCIKDPPKLSTMTNLQSFGFYPFDETQLICLNEKSVFQNLVQSNSFNKIDAHCWHQCGNQDTDNISKFLTGLASGYVNYDPETVTFTIIDRTFDFDEVFNYGMGGTEEYYDAILNPDIDPSFDKAPIRTVYGRVYGFVPVNLDYNSDTPTTSNNRNWSVVHGQSGYDSKSATIITSLDTTHFTISDADAAFFGPGDRVQIDKATDQFVTIVQIDKPGSNTRIEVDTVLTGTVAGQTMRKSFVQNVYLVDVTNNHWYQMEFNRDYTEANFGQNTRGFTLLSTAESHAGAPTFDPNNHIIVCDVSGKQTQPTVGGNDFDQNKNTLVSLGDLNFRNTWGSFQRVAIVLYDVLKTEFGMAESDIDTTAFAAWDAVMINEVGFAIPQAAQDEFPTYKDIIDKLLISSFSKAFFNADGQFSVKALGQIVTADNAVLKEEMFDSNFEYDYSNCTLVNHKWGFVEKKFLLTGNAKVLTTDPHKDFKLIDGWFQEWNNPFDYNFSGFSEDLRGFLFANSIGKTTDIETLLASLPYNELSTVTLFARIYLDRSCILTFQTKNALFQRFIGNSLEVTRNDLPGFTADGTDQSRDFTIVKMEKGSGGLLISLDDQKGIQETEVT